MYMLYPFHEHKKIVMFTTLMYRDTYGVEFEAC